MRSLSKVVSGLPHFASGEIIKGFGRGSKELGIPTANFSIDVVENLPKDLNTGVYYGYASIDSGDVHKMVMSIGWNPFFHNKHKSMETHILHKFNRDLYGSLLKVCIVGYLRPEKDFSSLESLIEAIKKDIFDAEEVLDDAENLKFKNHEFFNDVIKANDQHKSNGSVTNGSHHNLHNGLNGHI